MMIKKLIVMMFSLVMLLTLLLGSTSVVLADSVPVPIIKVLIPIAGVVS